MSLVPLLYSDWWEDLDRPHRLLDQHFGLPLNHDDLLDRALPTPSEMIPFRPGGRRRRRYHPFMEYALRRGGRGSSTAQPDKEKFLVTLDVQQFAPDEITVKVVDKNVIVEAKHEEKEDEHGWVSRQFLRKYLVPPQCDIDQVESHISSDGILTITAPRKEPIKDNSERIVKIQYTGQPAINNFDGHKETIESSKASTVEKEQPQQKTQTIQQSPRGKKAVKSV
ncbi:protein lethal(2)essential for life [Cephus cinctus]|uniref:Protein lethal(2)essential for life n=1 Tax=Cephus cinctus TaxID=211228 RepID=A0AAJ7CH25_CEPCN|nr:protein lethal(2)essential for life [Cephus cinctus]